MSPESQSQIPEWAERERSSDLLWISENLPTFWLASQRGYQAFGRGAIVVDTTTRHVEAGHPFYYLAEERIEELNDPDMLRMVRAYDPTWELVAVLLKPHERESTYRIAVPDAKLKASP